MNSQNYLTAENIEYFHKIANSCRKRILVYESFNERRRNTWCRFLIDKRFSDSLEIITNFCYDTFNEAI